MRRQTNIPNYSTTIDCLIRAKGNERTMAEFAKACGISAATLSRIANQRYDRPLSTDFIAKIYRNRADEDDTELLWELLGANGFLPAEEAQEIAANDTRLRKIERAANSIRGLLTNHWLDNGYSVLSIEVAKITGRFAKPRLPSFAVQPYDFHLLKRASGEKKTVRIIPYVDDSLSPPLNALFPYFLDDIFCLKANYETYFIFLVDALFSSFCGECSVIPVQSKMSALLVDIDHCEVLNEVTLLNADGDPHLDPGIPLPRVAQPKKEESHNVQQSTQTHLHT